MPGLLVKRGPQLGAMLSLGAPPVSLGRDADNDLRFDDRTVSRHHALIGQRDGEWYISDLGSRNQTAVNGESVVTARISHLDEIALGNVVLAFLDEAEDPADFESTVFDTRGAEITRTIRVQELSKAAAAAPQTGSSEDSLSHLTSLAELATSASLDVMLTAAIGSLQRVLQASRVFPVLQDPGTEPRAYCAPGGALVADLDSLAINTAIVERSQRQGPVAARAGRQGPHVACAPIRLGSRCLGAIYCERSDPDVPFTEEDLRALFAVCIEVGLAMEHSRSSIRLTQRTQHLTRQLEERYDMVGESPQMRAVYHFIRKVAPTDAGVLICGESGTGKELVARAIHRHSLRCDGPLEIVNCGAMPETLMESELFGHVRGAFTGAVADRAGRFELADGGTLFLDEVGELAPACQTKLLRVLEEGRIRRVGGTADQEVNVRVISATNRDPDEATSEGQLRKDLFYRLDRLRLVLPPLRSRGDDVERLARHFLDHFRRQCKRALTGFSAQAMDALRSYRWPGNVRELRNVVERMVILGDGPILGMELIPEDVRAAANKGQTGIMSLGEVEQQHILHVLRETEGNKKRAAEMLGIDRSTLYAKLKRYGVDA